MTIEQQDQGADASMSQCELSAGAHGAEPVGGWAHALDEAEREITSMRYQRDAAIQRAEETTPEPSASLELSDMQDFIAGVMQKWVGSNGGIYALHGCALEVAKAVLSHEASPSASPAPDEQSALAWLRGQIEARRGQQHKLEGTGQTYTFITKEDALDFIDGAIQMAAKRAASPAALSISDEMMDLVDRLGSQYDEVDPRAWRHLLIYAPKSEMVRRFLREDKQTTQTPDVSREHIVSLATANRFIGNYTTAEWVEAVIGFSRVLLNDNAVQEAFVRANIGLLASQPNEAQCKSCGGNDGDLPCAYPGQHERQPHCLRYSQSSMRTDAAVVPDGERCRCEEPGEIVGGYCQECGNKVGKSPFQATLESLAHDGARLDTLARESWDLRCFDMPTGQSDGDIGWRVIEHHEAKPQERVVAEVFKDDPRAAIDAALAAQQAAGDDGLPPGLRQSDPATLPNVDELVPPPAVGAEKVDAEAVDPGLDGAEGNLSAATDAHPHGDASSAGVDLHDRQSAATDQAVLLAACRRAALALAAASLRMPEFQPDYEALSDAIEGGKERPNDRLDQFFKNRLTSFGLLVRALRVVANTSLYDMATAMSIKSSDLSSMEFGRTPVTVEHAKAAAWFFCDRGINDVQPALMAALAAKTQGEN